MGLAAFDCLLILFQGSISQDEMEIAREAKACDQGICFVQTKCDNDLQAMLDDREITAINKQSALTLVEKCKHFIKYNLFALVVIVSFLVTSAYHELVRETDLVDVPCFFVSGRRMREYVAGEDSAYLFQEEELIRYVATKSKAFRSAQPEHHKE
jgi:hypothetical protein